MEQELNSIRAQLAETKMENSKIMLEAHAAQNGLLGNIWMEVDFISCNHFDLDSPLQNWSASTSRCAIYWNPRKPVCLQTSTP
jgi:hypothetical protein